MKNRWTGVVKCLKVLAFSFILVLFLSFGPGVSPNTGFGSSVSGVSRFGSSVFRVSGFGSSVSPVSSFGSSVSRLSSFSPSVSRNGISLSAALRFNNLYDSLELGALDLSREAFIDAVQGFLRLQAAGELQNTQVLTIVDFSLPSTQKRLFVIDMQNGRLLYNTLVAHGRNSGTLMATRFSNRRNSRMSSLGFYVTGDPFMGHNGYSLRLEGVERGWNDHADSRAIIMHPAEYVSEDHIRQWGFLGRSEGCPAIPEKLDQAIIDQIKGGSCLFLYAPDNQYLRRSDLLS